MDEASALDAGEVQAVTAQIDCANRLMEQGREQEAQRQYDAALCRYRQIRLDEDDCSLVLKYTQAQTLLRSGRLNDAQDLLRHITEQSQRRCGPAHPRTLLYRDTLASAYIRSGDFEAASTVLKSLLEARTEGGSADDARTMLSNASVAVTNYINQDDWGQALPLQALVVRFLRRNRAPNDTELLLSCSLLAVALVETAKLDEARRLLQTTSSSFVRVLGREHKETLRVFFLLAIVLEKQDDRVGAQAILERSHAIALKHLGENDDLTLRMGTKRACLLLHAHRYAEGQDLLLSVLPVAQRITGVSSTTTLTNLNNLAVALWQQGQHKVARGLAAEVLARKQAELGYGHPETREAQTQLSNMDRKLAASTTDDRSIKDDQYIRIEDCIEMQGNGAIGEFSYTILLRGFPVRRRRP